jgi:PAS domain-containing protein
MKETQARNPPGAAIIAEAEKLARKHPKELITVYGLDRVCYYASASIKAMEGYEPEEMVGRHYDEFVIWRDLPHVEIARTDAEFHKSTTLTVTVRTKSGEPLRVHNLALTRTDPTTGRIYFLARTKPVEA